MTGQLRSELLKLTTTRAAALLLLVAAGLSAAGVAVEGLSRGLVSAHAQRDVLSGGVTVGVFFSALAGILAMTGEFRYGTIRPTLLAEPRRNVVLAAKVAAAAGTGVVVTGACVAATFAAGLAVLGARGIDVALTDGDRALLIAGPIAAGALSAVAGVAVGTLIRNQAGAIVALAAYALIVDAGLFSAAPSVARYLPGKAGDALAGRPDDLLLDPGAGAVVLAGWALLLVVVAAVRHARSDV